MPSENPCRLSRGICPTGLRSASDGACGVAQWGISAIAPLGATDVVGVFWGRNGIGNGATTAQEASVALSDAVDAAQQYVQSSQVVGVDETGFKQGNLDGKNPKKSKGWLWVVVTPLVSFFQVCLSRSQVAAQTVLGSGFSGIAISDRCGSYNWIDMAQRQLCWAHLKRDFIAIAERSGVSKGLGEALLEQEKQLFQCWYQVRDGTCSRLEFIDAVVPIRACVKALLEEGASYPITAQEKTPLAKTVRTCANLLKFEAALWTFVTTEGVEPTNNASERALRPAVMRAATQFWLSESLRQHLCLQNVDRCDDLEGTKSSGFGLPGSSHSCRTAKSTTAFFTPRLN
jgi:transposase